MLGYTAYHGMPAHYPHWSYGKSYEKTKTMYDHGVTGLPYELVINSDPCLAYLMRDNTLCLQILTIAHVYGHNDFFKNNFMFTSATRADQTLGQFKARADRIRDYVEDPSIGLERVETLLDAAHALSMNCRRNPAIRKLAPEEQRQRRLEAARAARRSVRAPASARRSTSSPTCARCRSSRKRTSSCSSATTTGTSQAWEQDMLTIVHEEAGYFLPQIETKIMNEGWASYWHHQIMNSLDLPQEIHLEFLVRHNQVVSPHPGRHQSLSPRLQDLARHRAPLRRADRRPSSRPTARRTSPAARSSSRCARPTATPRSCAAS